MPSSVAPLAAHIVRGSRIACADINDEYAREGPSPVSAFMKSCARRAGIPRRGFSSTTSRRARGTARDVPDAHAQHQSRAALPVHAVSRCRASCWPRWWAASWRGWMGREHSPEVWMDFRAALIGGGLVGAAMSLLGQFALSRNVSRDGAVERRPLQRHESAPVPAGPGAAVPGPARISWSGTISSRAGSTAAATTNGRGRSRAARTSRRSPPPGAVPRTQGERLDRL